MKKQCLSGVLHTFAHIKNTNTNANKSKTSSFTKARKGDKIHPNRQTPTFSTFKASICAPIMLRADEKSCTNEAICSGPGKPINNTIYS